MSALDLLLFASVFTTNDGPAPEVLVQTQPQRAGHDGETSREVAEGWGFVLGEIEKE